jgi:hypothetical protein
MSIAQEKKDMRHCNGFLLLEMALYLALSATVISFFTGVTYAVLHWYKDSQRQLTSLLYHRRALLIIMRDIALSNSVARDGNKLLLAGECYDKKWQQNRWHIVYECRKKGLYRTHSTTESTSTTKVAGPLKELLAAEVGPGRYELQYTTKQGDLWCVPALALSKLQ